MGSHTTYSCDRCDKKDLNRENRYSVLIEAGEKAPVYAGEVHEVCDEEYVLCRDCKFLFSYFLRDAKFLIKLLRGEVKKKK